VQAEGERRDEEVLWFVAASAVLVRPRCALGRDALAAPAAH
jgi:hypothetical protein